MNAQLSPTRGYIGVRPSRVGQRPKLLTEPSVRRLYAEGHTQQEIAVLLETTQRTVSLFMRKIGLPARVAAKRDQKGEKNHMWLGDKINYLGSHHRVYRERGQAFGCGKCGSQADQKYHWANLTGDYLNTMDFMSMCVKCHRQYDNERRKQNNGRSTITR